MAAKRRDRSTKKQWHFSALTAGSVQKRLPTANEVRERMSKLSQKMGQVSDSPRRQRAQYQYHQQSSPSQLPPLFHRASRIPSNLGLEDHLWLHEREFKRQEPYIPPWRSKTEPHYLWDESPLNNDNVLEPTISPNRAPEVRDSCPASPLYTREVPDSEPDTTLSDHADEI